MGLVNLRILKNSQTNSQQIYEKIFFIPFLMPK